MGVEGQGSGLPVNVHFWLSSARVRFGGSCISSSRTWLTPRIDQANLPGYAIGYINFASFLVGSPVIYAHHFKFTVAWVYDPHPGAERQVRVRGGQAFGS